MHATLLPLATALLLAQAPPAPAGPPPTARLPAEQLHPSAEAAVRAPLDATPAHGAPAAQAAEHGAAAPAGDHPAAVEGDGHAGHDASVSGHIFHHVQDEPCWTALVWDKQAGAVLTGEAARGTCERVAAGDRLASSRYLNLSIGKHLVSMWWAAGLLVLVLAFATSQRALVPRGLYNFIESLVVFIRDEIAVKNIGEHHGHEYTPYLCTAFFFILFMNLFGLIPIPGVGTATSNLSVTLVLALFTFTLTQIAGMKAQGVVGYWAHLVPSGVPKWLFPIMLPVELLGLFTKPFALTVRLFANMLAGHIVIYFLLALTVLLTVYIAPVSIAFALGIYLLELFVAFVQAYVFTMLSALFIGMASHAH